MGGIIADAMGLGKTLTMITAIILTISQSSRHAANTISDHSGQAGGAVPQGQATLVVVISKRE